MSNTGCHNLCVGGRKGRSEIVTTRAESCLFPPDFRAQTHTQTNISVGTRGKSSPHLLAFNSSHKPQLLYSRLTGLQLPTVVSATLELTVLHLSSKRQHWCLIMVLILTVKCRQMHEAKREHFKSQPEA